MDEEDRGVLVVLSVRGDYHMGDIGDAWCNMTSKKSQT